MTETRISLTLPTSILAWLRANSDSDLSALALRLPVGWAILNGKLLTPEGRAYIV